MFYFCFREKIILPVGRQCLKRKYLTQQGIVHYGTIDAFYQAIMSAYKNDEINKFLEVGFKMYHSRRIFILEVVFEKAKTMKLEAFVFFEN